MQLKIQKIRVTSGLLLFSRNTCAQKLGKKSNTGLKLEMWLTDGKIIIRLIQSRDQNRYKFRCDWDPDSKQSIHRWTGSGQVSRSNRSHPSFHQRHLKLHQNRSRPCCRRSSNFLGLHLNKGLVNYKNGKTEKNCKKEKCMRKKLYKFSPIPFFVSTSAICRFRRYSRGLKVKFASKGSYCSTELSVRRRIGRGRDRKLSTLPKPRSPRKLNDEVRPSPILIAPEALVFGDGAGCPVLSTPALEVVAVMALVAEMDTVKGEGGRGLSGRSIGVGVSRTLGLTIPTARPTAVELTVSRCGEGGVIGSNVKAGLGTVTVLTHLVVFDTLFESRLRAALSIRLRPNPSLGGRRYERAAFFVRLRAVGDRVWRNTICEEPGLGSGVFWSASIILTSTSGSWSSRIFEKATRISTSEIKLSRRHNSFPRSVRQPTCSRIRPRKIILDSTTGKIFFGKKLNIRKSEKKNQPNSESAGGIFDEKILDTADSNRSTKLSLRSQSCEVYESKIKAEIKIFEKLKFRKTKIKSYLLAPLDDLNSTIEAFTNNIHVFGEFYHSCIKRLVIITGGLEPPIWIIANFLENTRRKIRRKTFGWHSFGSEGFFEDTYEVIPIISADFIFDIFPVTLGKNILPRVPGLVGDSINFTLKMGIRNQRIKFYGKNRTTGKKLLPRSCVRYRINSLFPKPAGERPPEILSTICTESSYISCQIISESPTRQRGRAWTTIGRGTAVVAALTNSTSSLIRTPESLSAASKTCLSVEKIFITDSPGALGYTIIISEKLKNKKLQNLGNFNEIRIETHINGFLNKLNIGWTTAVISPLPLRNSAVALRCRPHRKFSQIIYQKHNLLKKILSKGQNLVFENEEKNCNSNCKNDISRKNRICMKSASRIFEFSLIKPALENPEKTIRKLAEISRVGVKPGVRDKINRKPLIRDDEPSTKTQKLRRDKEIKSGGVWATNFSRRKKTFRNYEALKTKILQKTTPARKETPSRIWTHKHTSPFSPMYSSNINILLPCTDTLSTVKTQK